MNYALANPTSSRRSGLLAIVLGAHAGVFLLIAAARTVVPQIMDMPLVVELLPPAAPEPAAKPLPTVKPQPVRTPPTPRTPTPVLEASRSSVPAPAAPQTVASEPRPSAPPAPAPAAEAVSAARFDADYLRNPAPAYPALSRRLGEEGRVVLRVQVNPQGAADQVELKTSSGSARLDEAAVNTVSRWKFVPAKRGDLAVHSWVLVPIIFKLEQ